MQISGEGPAFGQMQMLAGRGENQGRESLRDRRGERETRAGAGLARAHCAHARGCRPCTASAYQPNLS